MLQKFSKDHKYKFSKEQLKKDLGENTYKSYCNNIEDFENWINHCDGKPVEVKGEYDRVIGVYEVNPEWCICVGRND